MKYDITIYDSSQETCSRYLLGTGGSRPLFVIGLNPSTADDKVPDRTMRKVMTFADNGGFDSFIMLNLYPQRTPYPHKVHATIDMFLHKENVKKIVNTLLIYSNPTILASWGQTIRIRPFFIDCLKDIFEATNNLNINWLKIGEPTSGNHPRHPSRAPYKFGLTSFDIIDYLKYYKQKDIKISTLK